MPKLFLWNFSKFSLLRKKVSWFQLFVYIFFKKNINSHLFLLETKNYISFSMNWLFVYIFKLYLISADLCNKTKMQRNMKFIQIVLQFSVYNKNKNKNKCEFIFFWKKCKQTAEISWIYISEVKILKSCLITFLKSADLCTNFKNVNKKLIVDVSYEIITI